MLNYKEEDLLEVVKKLDINKLREEFIKLQRICIDKNIPVVIMMDGFESSNRGYLIKEIVKDLDTKHYKVKTFDDFNVEKNDYRYTLSFWKSLPSYGDFAIFYRSMYYQLFNDIDISKKLLKKRIEIIKQDEKLLVDDHQIILKFFVDINEKSQKNNIKDLEEDKYKSVLISRNDKKQQKNFGEYKKHINKVLKLSNFDFCSWNIIPANDKKEAAKLVLYILINRINEEINRINTNKSIESMFVFNSENKEKFIDKVDTSANINEDFYYEQKDFLQKKIGEICYELHRKKIPTVVVFEGIDASGKGGSIQRLLNEVDPRIYSVNPTSAPNDSELNHHYLWRFYNNMPKKGEISIFDRSWYGRVLVERVEKLSNDYNWSRAYKEINNMEEKLVDQGVLLLKYNLVITKDEQEIRFRDREKEKAYKITEEDWRNREKWDEYIIAMDDMIYYTSTEIAPWKLISSEDKKYARIEIMKDFIYRANKILERK